MNYRNWTWVKAGVCFTACAAGLFIDSFELAALGFLVGVYLFMSLPGGR